MKMLVAAILFLVGICEAHIAVSGNPFVDTFSQRDSKHAPTCNAFDSSCSSMALNPFTVVSEKDNCNCLT